MLLTSRLLTSNTTLAKVTPKLSHNQDKSHAVYKALSYLADKTREYSNDELAIRICPNTILSNKCESLELTNSSALQMVKVNAVSLESSAPNYSLFSLPLLLYDRDHYYCVLQSDLDKKILNPSGNKDSVGITYYDGGARSFYSNKLIAKPENLAGMKIKVQQSPSTIAIMKTLGDVATPMTQDGLYTTLQQGAADGGENNIAVYADMHHAEVTEVYSCDEHTMIPDVLIISTDMLNKLNDKERTVLLKAADELMIQIKDVIWPAAEKETYDKMKGMDATVVDVDESAFKGRARPLHDEFKAKDAQSAKNPELVESM